MTIAQNQHTEALSSVHKRTRISKIGATAAFASVPLDVVVSDRTFLWAQSGFQRMAESRHMGKTAEWWFTHAATVGTIGIQALALAGLVTLSSGARDALQGFEAYVTEKQKHMKGPRKLASKAINSPITFLNFAGRKFEKVGNKFEDRKSAVAREIGKTIVDVGRTNAMSTTGLVMFEMGNEEKVTLGRKARIAATFAGSWVAVTEGIKRSYRGLGQLDSVGLGAVGDGAQEAVGFVGRVLAEGTSVYPLGPGAAFWGGVAAACLITGRNAVNYIDSHPEVLGTPEAANMPII